MYFYVYKGKFYWGRYQRIASDNSTGWYFRNKPAKLSHWYISGPYTFRITHMSGSGLWYVQVIYKGGEEHSYSIRAENMVYLREGWHLSNIDRHQVARDDTAGAFRNRLKEYANRYFLPFHKHSRCV